MKKIVTFALITGSALALAACDAKDETATETEMMAPAATDAAAAEADGLDPTGNPIGPSASAPAGDAAEGPMAAE